MSDTSPPNCIVLLDEHTANRIAAGEVIERPASVVKELLENSLDAGSTQISVVVENGGKDLIKITDNGCGMTREDCVMSLQRHATSKISSADDLDAISTLGFRGEALPSIASVSLIEIVTKPSDGEAGTRLECEAGTITNLESVGAADGTTISVRNLFFNTPARLKFLKTAQTELGHIADLVGQYAMVYPGISFRLSQAGREVLASPASVSMLNGIAAVLGSEVARKLHPILFETPAIRVHGYVASPDVNRNSRRDQVLFVNGRPIRSRTITHAIDEGYRGLIQPGRYPIAVVVIEVAPELVDVNVHPTKAEVKFSSEGEVHSAVHRAVNETLKQGAAVTPMSTPADTTRSRTDLTLRPDYNQGTLPGARPTEQDVEAFREMLRLRREEAISNPATQDPIVWQPGSGVPMEDSPVPEANFEAARTVALTGVKVIGQARNTYILAQCEDGVLIIDQHVAHERVLFDRMAKDAASGRPAVQMLMMPVAISMAAREATLVAQRLPELRQSGYELEAFGGNTFMMRGVPAALDNSQAEAVLRDMITELVDITVAKHLLVRGDQVYITASCKLAVKAGDSMTMPEMERLVQDLLECENPFTCPHGRPIIISLSNWELDRKFRRV